MGLDNDQALDSVLVNIRSTVQSCKGGVLLRDLQDDYKKLVGTCIPFEKFGYGCLETLLRDASNFVSIKKSTDGQLFVEAVADSSTAHLSSLISKQKRGKSKKDPKPSVIKASGSYRSRRNYAMSVCSNYSAASEKDKEIEELKSKLEREKGMNEELSFEVSRLQAELKVANKALINSINRQKHQQEIEDLNSKLEKEKKISRDSASQIIRLNSLVKIGQDSLSAEQDTVKKLKSQIESLQSSSVKESSPVYEYLSSATNSKKKCMSLQNLSSNGSWDGHLLETDAAEQLNSCKKHSPIGDQNPTPVVHESYEEQMSDQIQKFINQIKKQNQKLMLLEKIQQKNYQKLDEKIKKSSDSSNIENIIQRILEHPQFLNSEIFKSRSVYASDNMHQSIPSITPISSQSDNDSERSFKAGPAPAIARSKYGPPQVEAYRTKESYYRWSYKMDRNC